MAAPATFKERVAAMVAAVPSPVGRSYYADEDTKKWAAMRRDLRAEFVYGLKSTHTLSRDIARAIGTSDQNLSSYIRGKSCLGWSKMKHILWILKGDFSDGARRLCLASPEEVEGMVREVGAELDRFQRIEGVTQTLTAKALGVYLQNLNSYMTGRRPWPYSLLTQVVWLLDGEKEGEGEV